MTSALLEAEATCRHLLARFIDHYDRGEADACAELFTDDAEWTHAGTRVVGRAAVTAELHARPADPPARHLVTSFFLDDAAEDDATGRAQLVLFHTRVDEAGRRHGEVKGVGEFRTTFRRTSDGWRLRTHEGRESFALTPS